MIITNDKKIIRPPLKGLHLKHPEFSYVNKGLGGVELKDLSSYMALES